MTLESFNLSCVLPYYSFLVSAGFPSPADDYVENNLNLNDLLVKHPAATFMMRMTSSSMSGAGILKGDVLVIDRSLVQKNQDLVVTCLNGEFTVRKLIKIANEQYLLSEGKVAKKIKLSADDQIWGVVTGVVRVIK
jgi:DNA polymerase V